MGSVATFLARSSFLIIQTKRYLPLYLDKPGALIVLDMKLFPLLTSEYGATVKTKFKQRLVTETL